LGNLIHRVLNLVVYMFMFMLMPYDMPLALKFI